MFSEYHVDRVSSRMLTVFVARHTFVHDAGYASQLFEGGITVPGRHGRAADPQSLVTPDAHRQELRTALPPTS